MTRDDDNSLGGGETFAGGASQGDSPKSLGDEATYGGMGPGSPESFGDEVTFGGGGNDAGDDFIDEMEIVDLAARYTTEGTLGKGGMGEVLLATDTRLNRKVAIKRILGDAARSRTAVSRFLTEAQSIAALNHPNIVQIYDYGRATDGPFLIMEYVEGNSLLDKCREGPIELAEAVDLTCQLCDGLAKAHAANIIHRDIKPANVLMTTDGVPKLTDFGLAKDDTTDTGMTMAGAVLGTLDFMPPEQRKDAALTDNRSDLWSLAATLYQMLTGESPKVIRIKKVPEQLQDVLDKALEESKEDRYPNAIEFRDALRECLKDDGSDVSDLGEGQCPHCGTKNDSSRKFCRNCAGSLEAPCFSCSAGMPMWENVCGSCGSKQEEHLEKRREQMAAQRSRAEELMDDHHYTEAIKLAEQLGAESDHRLQQLKSWSERFIADCQTERDRALTRAAELLGESLTHEKAHDYPSGIRALEQVPSLLLDAVLPGHRENASVVLERLGDKQNQCEEIERSIRSQIQSQEIDGLRELVENLLELLPDREDVLRFRAQLLDREANQKKHILAIVEKAQKLRSQLKFEEASQLLNRVPADLRCVELKALLEQCDQLSTSRSDAMNALRSALKTERFSQGIQESSSYLAILNNDAALQDLAFTELQKKVNAGWDRQEEERKQAKQQKALLKKIWIGVTLAVAAVLLLIVGMWGLSVQRANALASALDGQRWDEVLSMDPDNVPALIGRANNAIVSSRPDLDWVLAEVERIESLDLSNPTANEIKGKVYALESIQASENGDVNAGETKLRQAKRLKVDSSYADRATRALVQTYVERAESSVASGNASQAIADAKRAMTLDSNIALPASIALAIVESNATDLVNAYMQNPSAEILDAVVLALDKLESLDAQSSVLKSLRTKMQATALANAESTAADLVDAYERLPTNARLSAAASALNTASGLATNPNKASLVSLRNRLAAVLLQSITAFESTRSSTDLQSALTSAKQLETKLKDQTFASGANSRIATALVKRFGEISLDQSLDEISLLDNLNADSTTRQAANRLLGSSLVRRFRDSLGKGDYKTARDDYSGIASLDTNAAKQVSGDWLKIPEQDYDQIPTSALTNLPASVIAKLPPRTNSIGMKLKLIPAGRFLIGSESGEADKKPSHKVTLTKPYELGVYEVTQEQYERVMGTNPSVFKGSINPVEEVSWEDAVEFCEKLSSLPAEQAAGRVYRLPTEAEWEYACRAGTTTEYSFGDDAGSLGEYAWYKSNSGGKTHPVGEKLANPWGLYDMRGNVWEWCSDWSGDFPSGSVTDPVGASSGSLRVNRGGCWRSPAEKCRSAHRNASGPSVQALLGFRVTCVPSGQ